MFKPPPSAIKEAKLALLWRNQYNRGGTHVGLNTARILASGKPISLKKVKHISRYFPRHAVDAQAQGWRKGEKGYPSNGRIAWALWGGTSAWKWSKQVLKKYRGNIQLTKLRDLKNDYSR